jgi:hypothetical protein
MQWIYAIKQILTHFNTFLMLIVVLKVINHLNYITRNRMQNIKIYALTIHTQLPKSLDAVLTTNWNSCLSHVKNMKSVCEHCEKISYNY